MMRGRDDALRCAKRIFRGGRRISHFVSSPPPLPLARRLAPAAARSLSSSGFTLRFGAVRHGLPCQPAPVGRDDRGRHPDEQDGAGAAPSERDAPVSQLDLTIYALTTACPSRCMIRCRNPAGWSRWAAAPTVAGERRGAACLRPPPSDVSDHTQRYYHYSYAVVRGCDRIVPVDIYVRPAQVGGGRAGLGRAAKRGHARARRRCRAARRRPRHFCTACCSYRKRSRRTGACCFVCESRGRGAALRFGLKPRPNCYHRAPASPLAHCE